MQSLHHPHDVRSYNKGANRDLDKELFAVDEGVYIDACNFRTMPMDGDNATAKKINGEILLYPNLDNACVNPVLTVALSGNYECIGVVEINENIVEFWADDDEAEPSLIRVNGVIVLKSDDFPIKTDFPLQIAKNEACIGGEVYFTDFNSPPMLFNIKDLMLNGGMLEGDCTPKYFEDFNIAEHILVLTQALDHPIFIKLTLSTVGIDVVLGAGGMPVGYYTYGFRYVTDAGDRTGFSAPTPQIPVVVRDSDQCSPVYPSSMTHSKDPDISSPTTLGVHIKLRVNNVNDYDFIEILRVKWNAGDLIGTPPVREIIGKIDIAAQEFAVYDILDLGADAEEILSTDEGSDVMAAISRAKAIRYFNSRLYLMNIEYGSKDIDDETTLEDESSGGAMYPTIQKIDKDGHIDPWKYTYYKSYLHGEKYGFGLFVWDEQGNRSYVRKISGFDSYQFPNRRDPISSLTSDTSYRGTCRAATTELTNVQQTHEVFDLANAVSKTDKCQYHNILEKGSVSKSRVNISGCTKAQDEGLTNTVGRVTASKVGYRPWTPTGQDDARCGSTNHRLNLNVRKGHNGSSKISYDPYGFAPNYFAQGIALEGVTGLPVWAKAFSVVRTAPAGKVVAQGLGFYDLETAGGIFGSNAGKNMNKFAFWSPDTDSGIGINPTVVDDIINNPTNYEIQLVSPLGFFSEVYSFNNREGLGTCGTGIPVITGADTGIDMMIYARIISDLAGVAARINPDENPNMGIPDGASRYVSYAKWRSNTFQGTRFSGATAKGNRTFGVSAFAAVVEGRGEFYKITTTSNVYSNGTAGGQVENDDDNVQNWHEPLYIVNIVRKLADIPDTNTVEYVPTGHYQKLDSVIGKGNGLAPQSFELVDERWEDCIDDITPNVINPFSALLRFAYVRDENEDELRWVNVTNLSSGAITSILTDLQNNGVATVTDTSGSFQVYGVYKHTEIVDNTAELFTLVFDHFNTSFDEKFFRPDADTLVIVKYDNRIPIRIFGGDVGIGEGIFAPQDNLYNKKACPSTVSDEFKLNIAFPYMRYDLNPRIFVVNSATGVNKIQDKREMKFENSSKITPAFIRQLCAMFTVESRTNLTYAYNIETPEKAVSQQYFPLVNYIMRPYNFKDNEFEGGISFDIYDDNNIQDAYEDDYGAEWQLWGWGGLRFLISISMSSPQSNIDYSKDDNSLGALVSVPKVGFEEQNLFCTRIIWSEKRPPNIQDTPTVRTFPEGNIFDISDDTGEIKFAWDDISSKGNNLYAITDGGICVLLIDKRIVHEISGNELATVGSDIGGILDQLWINKQIGMTDEMWRSFAEYSNQLFFCNYKSGYKLADSQILDIGRQHYHSKLHPEFLKDFGRGYSDHITGEYDVLHNEYWVSFGRRGSIGEGGQSGAVVVEHELNDILDIVGIEYDIPNLSNDGLVGVSTGDTVKITSCSGSPKIIYIGGFYQNQLPLVTAFSICNECTETIDVQQYIAGSHVTAVLIAEGECYCFTLIPNTKTWQAAACSPFGGNSEEPLSDYTCPTQVWGEAQQYWQGGFTHKFDRFLSFDNKMYGMKDMETYKLDEGTIINGVPIEGEISSVCAAIQSKDKEFIRIRVNSSNKPTKIEFFENLEQLLSDDVQAEILAADLKDYHGFEQYIPRKLLAPYDRMQGRLLIFKIKHDLEEDFKVVTTDIQYKSLK